MRFFYLMHLIALNIRRNRLRSVLIVVLLSSCILALVLSDRLVMSSNKTIENNITNIISNREITIQIEITEDQRFLNLHEHIKTIKNVSHIKNAYPYFEEVDACISEKADSLNNYRFKIRSGTYEHFPKVVSGEMFDLDDKNVALMPSALSIESGLHKGDADAPINGCNYLGRELVLQIKSKKTGEKFEYKCIVVGLYKLDGLFYRENAIFIPLDDLYEILSIEYKQEKNQLFQTDNYLLISAYADSYKNVGSVISELSAMPGYTVNYLKDERVNVSAFESLALTSSMAFYIILVLIFLIINVFLRNILMDRMYEIALYKAIGYKLKHIFWILYLEVNSLIAIAYTIGLLIALPTCNYVIFPIIQNKFSNSFLKLSIGGNWDRLIICLIIIPGISLISCIGLFYKTMRIPPNIYCSERGL